PDPEIMIEAAHVDALEADRQQAPIRTERAVRHLQDIPGVAVAGKILEGAVEEVILEEARHWNADLIVVGSHGYNVVARRVLGSVSHALALHAPCSVEIVRGPAPEA